MLRIMIVEDDGPLAMTLKYLVEDNPRYHVVGLADDLESALLCAADHRPDLALVDLQLANDTTGFSVAVRLHDQDVQVLFVTGRAPDFPMPDLALGWLMKPFTAEDIHRGLAIAEDVMRGRETVRQRVPCNLTVYESSPAEPNHPNTGFIPSRPSLKTRLEHWLAGTQGVGV